MTFKEWLPMTARNRVALGLAVVALVAFVTWNFLPEYVLFRSSSSEGLEWRCGGLHAALWPQLFNPSNWNFSTRTIDAGLFLGGVALIGLMVCGLTFLMLIPFWVVFSSYNFLRLSLALMNLVGGISLAQLILGIWWDFPVAYVLWGESLIFLSMFLVSAALFTFKNELALRNPRSES